MSALRDGRATRPAMLLLRRAVCCEPDPCSVIWPDDAICEPCARARLAFYELAGASWTPIVAKLWPGGYETEVRR